MPMKNVYFLSDAHLGSRAIEHSRTQERRLVNFLDSIKHQASAVYLLGDMFDFWYEFKMVVPKGYTRFLGKISELTDLGVEVHFFIGNHDIWCGDYLVFSLVLKSPTSMPGDMRISLISTTCWFFLASFSRLLCSNVYLP